MTSVTTVTAPEVMIERVFEAPRELVFEAWTQPALLLRWFAPERCAIHFAQISVQPGGRFLSCITPPNGKQCWCAGEYREVSAPERLVFTMGIADAEGNLIGPEEAGMDPAWPRETVLTVTFTAQGDKTLLRLHQTVDEALAKKTGAYPSWLSMFTRLDNVLKDRE